MVGAVAGPTQRRMRMIGTGDKIPDVKLFKATPDGPNDVSIGDYLSGKKTVLFAVPGAFTPT